MPVPTEGVTIRDDFNAKTFGRYILGSGRLVVSGKKVADLEDEFIQRIIGGASVPLDEVIDMIPAKSSVSIVYFVNCIPSIGHGTGPEGSPTPDDELKRQGRFKLTEIEAAQADAEAEAVGTEQTGPARYVPAS
ncbi:TPA: hypothetical protein DIV55_02980, partial [Patescibacteria group bacterium]|nr:hypothetical protein [Patescibacteria group bacterium]